MLQHLERRPTFRIDRDDLPIERHLITFQLKRRGGHRGIQAPHVLVVARAKSRHPGAQVRWQKADLTERMQVDHNGEMAVAAESVLAPRTAHASMHLIANTWIAILALVWALPVIGADASSQCTEGVAQPVDPRLPDLRPTRTAECRYGFDELIARMTQLSINKLSPDTVESVEKAFGMPEMTTSYDAPRIASYMMVLSGTGGWKLVVWVREAFYPVDKGVVRFVPGLRPKRLYKIEDATLRVDLTLVSVSRESRPALCVPVSPLIDALLGAGWQDMGDPLRPPVHGRPVSAMLGYGSKRISISGQRGSCANSIALMQGGRQNQ